MLKESKSESTYDLTSIEVFSLHFSNVHQTRIYVFLPVEILICI